MSTVAQLVDSLFRTHRRPDNGREYTYKEVCVALGGDIEPSHLSKLRSGKIPNPGRETLLALCRFFKVSPTYFFPELEALPGSENNAVEASQAHLLHIVLRSAGLRPDVEEKLEALIQALRD